MKSVHYIKTYLNYLVVFIERCNDYCVVLRAVKKKSAIKH